MSSVTDPGLLPAGAAFVPSPLQRPRSDGDGDPGAKRARTADPETQQLGLGQPDQFGNHPDGSWTCPHCGNVNWPRRTVCNNRRCMRPKVEGATGAVDSGTPPGSWVCQLCNNLNWPRRTVCNRCQGTKGMSMGGGMGGLPPPVSMAASMAAPPPSHHQHPPGSWACPTCGNINWPQRTVCNRRNCETQRPAEEAPPLVSSFPSANKPQDTVADLHLQTQIQALHMLAMQDPANAQIYMTQLQQLQLASQVGAGGGFMAGGGGGMRQQRQQHQHPDGSWKCPVCNNINWPKRDVCNRAGCDTPRPANAGIPASQEIGGGAAAAVATTEPRGVPAAGGYGDTGGYAGAGGYGDTGGYAGAGGYGGAGGVAMPGAYAPPAQKNPMGSWVCPLCQNVNWPMRTVCNRRGCEQPRPPQ